MSAKKQEYELGPDVAADEPVYDSHGNRIDADYIEHAVADVHDALAGRPSLSGRGSSPQVAFRVPPAVRDAAQRLAHDEGVSLSEFAREALEERIARAS